MAAFAEFPDRIPAGERQRLTTDANDVYSGFVLPALKKLLGYVTNVYLPAARSTIAMTDLPGGSDWYRYKVRIFTTTNLTPREIHEMGLEEVARIRTAMDSVIAASGFHGTFDDFVHFLKTDPGFYYTSREELLAGYRDIAKRADPELVKLFGTLPRLPYGVIAVPGYSERSQTAAYYQPGSPAAGRPGYFYANTYNLPARPKWEMEALTLHEAVPGHHLQLALALELEDVPDFRKYLLYNAYTEGWGLYAETLGYDMGFYEDPYSRFGQLAFQMWRAVRLVVDTGIHALGWSRQQAIDYFKEQSGRPEHDVTVEVDRYIAWPGQALGYMIGKLEIEKLRDRAMTRLGPRFDIREFHDQVLVNGGLPLNILETQIDAWIDRQLH